MARSANTLSDPNSYPLYNSTTPTLIVLAEKGAPTGSFARTIYFTDTKGYTFSSSVIFKVASIATTLDTPAVIAPQQTSVDIATGSITLNDDGISDADGTRASESFAINTQTKQKTLLHPGIKTAIGVGVFDIISNEQTFNQATLSWEDKTNSTKITITKPRVDVIVPDVIDIQIGKQKTFPISVPKNSPALSSVTFVGDTANGMTVSTALDTAIAPQAVGYAIFADIGAM